MAKFTKADRIVQNNPRLRARIADENRISSPPKMAVPPGWRTTPQGGYVTPRGDTFNPQQGPRRTPEITSPRMNTANTTPSSVTAPRLGDIFMKRLKSRIASQKFAPRNDRMQ